MQILNLSRRSHASEGKGPDMELSEIQDAEPEAETPEVSDVPSSDAGDVHDPTTWEDWLAHQTPVSDWAPDDETNKNYADDAQAEAFREKQELSSSAAERGAEVQGEEHQKEVQAEEYQKEVQDEEHQKEVHDEEHDTEVQRSNVIPITMDTPVSDDSPTATSPTYTTETTTGPVDTPTTPDGPADTPTAPDSPADTPTPADTPPPPDDSPTTSPADATDSGVEASATAEASTGGGAGDGSSSSSSGGDGGGSGTDAGGDTS